MAANLKIVAILTEPLVLRPGVLRFQHCNAVE
ncbi:hypothetical protein B398_10695 [Xylella fastidiosa 32]|nr:hypothetical protein B398_10695 [Xylella fastidiosa 32]